MMMTLLRQVFIIFIRMRSNSHCRVIKVGQASRGEGDQTAFNHSRPQEELIDDIITSNPS